jgi:hypothetical protein
MTRKSGVCAAFVRERLSVQSLVVSASLLAISTGLIGCAGSPVQKPMQTIAPDSATAAKLNDVQAQVLSLAQQNTAIINAVQKSAQDTDQFRTEVKGNLASLTQVQFRFESWLAEVSSGWRMRVLGCAPYLPAGKAGPELVDGRDGVRDSSGADARSAAVGADQQSPVLKAEKGLTFMEKIGWLVAGMIVATIGVSILASVFQGIAAKVEAKEDVILVDLVNFAKALLLKIGIGKKAAAAK